MLDEIHEQAEAVGRVVELDGLQEIAAAASASMYAVIAARGTSDNAARYAQYVWGARNRMTVALAAPSLFGPYSSPPALGGAMVVGLSQSGASPDLVEVIREAKRQDRPTVAVTNHANSPLAVAADVVLDLRAGVEQAVAATKTYTAELAAVARISEAMAGRSGSALREIVPAIAHVLDSAESIAAGVAPVATADRCVVIGRGFHRSTAFEWALKMEELAQIVAQPFSAADFLHGPIAAVGVGTPVLAVATRGPVFDDVAAIARRLSKRGAPVVAITDDPSFPAEVRIRLPVIDEWLAPIVAAPALQLFSRSLAVARGLDPDSPRELSKVTRTR